MGGEELSGWRFLGGVGFVWNACCMYLLSVESERACMHAAAAVDLLPALVWAVSTLITSISATFRRWRDSEERGWIGWGARAAAAAMLG